MTENIHIAIVGPISAGKTTLLNTLCANAMSNMARKKTTMLPQIYQIVDGEKVDTIEEIYQKNKASNEEILKLREVGEFDHDCHFTEIIHKINPILDFIQLPDNVATYSILDMPGLNCAGDTLYYDYAKRISSEVDIYLVVFDINSGLNTTDEINILKFIVEQIQQNTHGYIHILINKCDNITIDGDTITFADAELNELYERSKEAIFKHCAPIQDKVSISPLCAQKLYIYRSIKNDITTIEEIHLNDIISEELGKKGLKEFSDIAAKREYVSGLINSATFNDWIKNTGYNKFIYCLDQILKNYSEIVFYHINADLTSLQLHTICDDKYFEYFDLISEEIGKIKIRIQKAKKCATLPIPQYLLDSLEIINKELNTHLIFNYSKSTIDIIDIILEQIDNYYAMLGDLFDINPLESAKNALLDARIHILIDEFIIAFNKETFKELHEGYFYAEGRSSDNSSDKSSDKSSDGSSDDPSDKASDKSSDKSSDRPFDLHVFNTSVTNMLEKNMNNIIYISDIISEFDQLKSAYMENLIHIFVKLLETNKIDSEIFLQFLPKFNNIDKVIISKAITNFMITNFTINDEPIYTKIICTKWATINGKELLLTRIQYIFLSRTFMTFASVDNIYEKVDEEMFDNIINILDKIFKILKAIV
jgi:hypothetical protein